MTVSLVIEDLAYEAKAKTFFSRPRPKTWKLFNANIKANWESSYHYELKFALQ